MKRCLTILSVVLFFFFHLVAYAGTAKNVIVMISDGQGYNTIAATDYYTGTKPIFDFFPVKLAMQTFSASNDMTLNPRGYDPEKAWVDTNYVKANAADSASAATAMFAGVKDKDGRICQGADNKQRQSIFELLSDRGKAVGVLSSVPWSHATPAAAIAHHQNRHNYAAIAGEMIGSGKLAVIMGTGNPDFDDDGRPSSQSARLVGGEKNWSDLKAGRTPYQLIQAKEDFEALAAGTLALTKGGKLIGTARVFTTLQQARKSGNPQKVQPETRNALVPSIAVMAVGALNILSRNPNGYAVMMETGGAVDWAAHKHQKGRLIEEQQAHHEAVQTVYDWVKTRDPQFRETLIIVTADHETGYVWGPRGPFHPVQDNGSGKMPGLSFGSSHHTNSLVPLYAIGAGSESFSKYIVGVDPVRGAYVDNTAIFRIIAEAAMPGDTNDHCLSRP
jgi:alkaline phosphatase